MSRAPCPWPPLSARMRPPCASTRPLQMASPRPPPIPRSPSSVPTRAYFRNRCGSRSGAMPRPSSRTETATCTPSRAAATRMGDDSGECLAALTKRLFSTCTMRRRSAITRGSSGARSMRTSCPLPPLRNVFLARSTRVATSVGSGATESVPESMRPASSRSLMSPRMWSVCSTMMRKNSRISARSSVDEVSIRVAAAPLIEVSGARSSWLTMSRNSARSRSISSSGARSCMVTTTDSTVPSAAWIGVALISVATLRPSGTESSISSECMVPALPSSRNSGNWSSAILPPVREPARHHPQQLLGRLARGAQGLDDALRRPVERQRRAGPGVEDHDPDR